MWKESLGLEEEDKREWVAANEDTAKKMMKYLEGSEDLKVSLGELKEQLESPQGAGDSVKQIAKQARHERGKKLFQMFRQEEKEVYIASLARWNTQLKGLVELERLCAEVRGRSRASKRKTSSVGRPDDWQGEYAKKSTKEVPGEDL